VVVRGAGDLATGVIYILTSFGFREVATEIAQPSAIRRTVALSEAVYDGMATVEGLTGVLCRDAAAVRQALARGQVPVVVDPESRIIGGLRPDIVVDAIVAKTNLGTSTDMAPIVVGVGPGFFAGQDVHAVVETARGHELGRAIFSGPAQADTGVPGLIGGYGMERVIHSPREGVIRCLRQIGERVHAEEAIAFVDDEPVRTKIGGTLRGLIRSGYRVTKGFKLADVDPRDVKGHCFTISDKARMVGFGVLFAIRQLSKGD
jgi:xanthine dehydrogenase accessory factor